MRNLISDRQHALFGMPDSATIRKGMNSGDRKARIGKGRVLAIASLTALIGIAGAARGQCTASGSAAVVSRFGTSTCYLVSVTECLAFNGGPNACCGGVAGFSFVCGFGAPSSTANCQTQMTAVQCGGYILPLSGNCGAWSTRVFVPPCGTDTLDLTRARIRRDLQNYKSRPRIRTKSAVIGVRGFLPGTVELFRFGKPNEVYRWRNAETNALVLNGSQPSGSSVSGADSAHMTIAGIDTPDEGLYVLEASTNGGTSYSMVDAVRVYVEKPVADIISMPQDREACLGGSTDFLVIADEPGGTPATYRWHRNGTALNDGTLSGVGTVSGATTPLLSISNLDVAAAGTFTCTIVTGSYVNNTFDAALTISDNVSPPVILGQPQSVSAPVDAEAYMIADVDVQPGQVPSFQWRKNGVPIYDDGRIEGAQTEQLLFTRVVASDVASYDCVVTRGCASTVTSGASLSTCAADLDNGSGTGTRDGGVDVSDLLYFLASFEAGSTAVDLDNGSGTGTPDGGVDISDLLFFLARFEAGC